MAQTQPVKGSPWFAMGNQPGDRTLGQQLMGLDPLFAEVEGKGVLDVGCAEGLISLELAKSGASTVLGLEIRRDAVEAAHRARRANPLIDSPLKADFICADANTFREDLTYDIVLMLAVLHKLKNPTAACAHFAQCARDLVIIRLPPEHAPTIIDDRSGGEPHHIGRVMGNGGFNLEQSGYSGPFGEWIGYFRRARRTMRPGWMLTL